MKTFLIMTLTLMTTAWTYADISGEYQGETFFNGPCAVQINADFENSSECQVLVQDREAHQPYVSYFPIDCKNPPANGTFEGIGGAKFTFKDYNLVKIKIRGGGHIFTSDRAIHCRNIKKIQ